MQSQIPLEPFRDIGFRNLTWLTGRDVKSKGTQKNNSCLLAQCTCQIGHVLYSLLVQVVGTIYLFIYLLLVQLKAFNIFIYYKSHFDALFVCFRGVWSLPLNVRFCFPFIPICWQFRHNRKTMASWGIKMLQAAQLKLKKRNNHIKGGKIYME